MSKRNSSGARRPISKTALRLTAVFGAIFALFGMALAVTLVALNEIAEMESQVIKIDRAKHAGHHAAALVREQYIHQAHAIINWDLLHLEHYNDVARATRAQTDRVQTLDLTLEEKTYADEVVRLAMLNDEMFRTDVVPAIERNDRSVARELADQLEAHVDEVVRINEQLNAMLERRSTSVLERTQASRQRVLVTILGCFGLAILAALTLGLMLMRSILRPLAGLREGVLRLAQGDLTTRIQLAGKDEFSELAARFNRMAADLTRHQDDLVRSHKLASIGQIAAGVAHEINNPLAVILGYVRLMLKESTETKACELHVIEDEARQCQHIVQGLLDLARPMRLDVTRIDLAEIVCDAVERLKGSGKLDALEIQQIPQDMHLIAHGDETKLRQVVFNVILNAAEAMPSGGHLGIQMELENEGVRLSVTDTGPGIPADVLPYVFDPFFTTKPRGAGLGLVTSQAVADAHGGSIDIQSRPGKGTWVILRIPLRAKISDDSAPPCNSPVKPKEHFR